VRDLRPPPTAGFEVRFETPPGEQAQVDFAYFEVEFADEPGIKRRPAGRPMYWTVLFMRDGSVGNGGTGFTATGREAREGAHASLGALLAVRHLVARWVAAGSTKIKHFVKTKWFQAARDQLNWRCHIGRV
jgi:hypothetical protein